jgi:hypothetical protein
MVDRTDLYEKYKAAGTTEEAARVAWQEALGTDQEDARLLAYRKAITATRRARNRWQADNRKQQLGPRGVSDLFKF